MASAEINGAGAAVLRAVITRADGTVEDLGIISTSNPKWWSVKKRLVLRRMKKIPAVTVTRQVNFERLVD